MKRGRKPGDVNPNSAFQKIKRRLERGWSIDSATAFTKYGVMRLGAIIHMLRNQYNMNITTESVKNTTNPGSHAKYKLAR